MEETVNQLWFDALLRHQIYSLRVAGSVRNEINELLTKTEDDVGRWIRDALRGDVAYTPRRLAKAKESIKRIKALRGAAWGKADKLLQRRMADYIREEVSFLANALETVVPVVLEAQFPSANYLQSLVKSKPFEGRTLKQWSASMADADLRRIEDQIKIGLVQGEDSVAIAKRVIGTKALKGRDGITAASRANAEAVSRTAVNFFSNSARQEFIDANSDLFTEEFFVATLDSRTTPICRSLDGNKYKVGEGPIPPLHFSCRSTRVASINGELLGQRPAKPVTERMLMREFTKNEGLKVGLTRDSLPRGYKGQYDSFAGRRIREMTGRVPAKISYQSWLNTQTASFQDDVLGPTRGALFRRGNLKLTQFVNRAGDEIPLAQLAQMHANAFRAAGLDPGAFYR